MRDSIWTNFGHESNALPGKLHVLQLEWGIRQDRDPDDTPRSPRRGHFTWIFAIAGCGQILIAQNTNLRPGVKHRLCARVTKDRA
jgi:hypothetical protein